MTNRSIIKLTLTAFALIMAFNLGTVAQKTDCSKTTDREIVLAVYEKLKVNYGNEIKHINVRSTDGVVTIEGWATTKKIKGKVEGIVKKIKCVKKVLNELTVGKGGGCAPGQKECGGACIPEKESCNICLVDSSAPGCLGSETKPKN